MTQKQRDIKRKLAEYAKRSGNVAKTCRHWPITEDVYGIPPERVIGSSNALRYLEDNQGGTIAYAAEPDVFDDGPVKPIRIWSRV